MFLFQLVSSQQNGISKIIQVAVSAICPVQAPIIQELSPDVTKSPMFFGKIPSWPVPVVYMIYSQLYP